MHESSPAREILHLAKYYYPSHGGVETATRDLAEAAVELGHKVRCQSAGVRGQAGEYVHNGVSVRSYPQRWKALSTPLGPGLLFQKIDRAPLLHVHLPNPLIECRVLLRMLIFPRARHKVVPFFHAFPVGQGRLGRLWYRFITAPILNRAPAILISNPYLLSSFPFLVNEKRKFVVMPFAADPISREEWDSLRARRLGGKTAVAVGRMVPYKGYRVLLEAWKKMREDPACRGYRLRLIGEGPEEPHLKAFAVSLGGSVEFDGSITEARKWEQLRGASLLVAPSTTTAETFGISILEGMSVGLPVITTTLETGVASLARGGQCGAVVEPGDVNALAEKLKALLGDPARALDTAGLGNLSFVRERHSRAHLRERYGAFLDECFNEF